MAWIKLLHGTVTGLKCPHCRPPLVVQRRLGGTALEGLGDHIRVVHPEKYAAWLELGQ